jgi:hypothetical protein
MVDQDPVRLRLLLETQEVARLIKARPHVFPPCANPPYHYPFVYEEGVITNPRSDSSRMTNEVWRDNRCTTVDWAMIIVEFALNGNRHSDLGKRPTTLNVVGLGEGQWTHCFGNCMVCWRSQKRNFADATKTPFPYTVTTHHPGTPQLGCCGCVLCNHCIRAEFGRHPGDHVISCPYCAGLNSFSRDVVAWIVSADVNEKEHSKGNSSV